MASKSPAPNSLKSILRPYTLGASAFGAFQFSWKSSDSSEIQWNLRSRTVKLTLFNFIFLASYLTAAYKLNEPLPYEKVLGGASRGPQQFIVDGASRGASIGFISILVFGYARKDDICAAWNSFAKLHQAFTSEFNDINSLKASDRIKLEAAWSVAVIFGVIAFSVCMQLYTLYDVMVDGVSVALCIGGIYCNCWCFAVLTLGSMFYAVLRVWAELFESLAYQVQGIQDNWGVEHGEALLVSSFRFKSNVAKVVRLLGIANSLEDAIYTLVEAWKYHLLQIFAMLGGPVLFGSFMIVVGQEDDVSSLIGKSITGSVVVVASATLVMVCRAAEHVTMAELKFARTLGRASILNQVPYHVACQIQNNLTQINTHPVRISLNGYFTVNNGFLTSLLTGALTYLVVLIQFETKNSGSSFQNQTGVVNSTLLYSEL